MISIEVGCNDGQVVLLITGPPVDGVAECPMTPDEARDLCNGLGAAIKCVSRARTMT